MTGLEGLLRGRVLGGRYRVEEVIGRGGMGAVYRAVDERLGRKVAVKVITAAMGNDEDSRRRIRARFHREARAAAALPHHPNVVPVYDYGTDEELGLDYIVMELLEGHDLATRLQRAGAPPLAASLRILREAARGLAVGHRAGLVHRDVKPGNIFLARDHDELQVRMVDFGIAKLVDDEDTANQLTQDGRTPHSPAYASPEQLRGLTQLAPASDVFSLGAVGYQLLTGERPYSDSDRNRMSLGMSVPPPSLRNKNPAIPAAIEQIIQKSLAYDVADRYPDAMALVSALDQSLRELPNSPVEPYEAIPAGVVPLHLDPPDYSDEDDDERTQLMDVGGADDERTRVMDFEPVPTRAPVEPPVVAPRPEKPSAKPPKVSVAPARKRSMGPIVWTLVLLMLLAVGVWAFLSQNNQRRLRAELTVADSLALDSAAAADTTTPPPNPGEINENGRDAFLAGRFSDALGLFERAIELDPNNAEFRQNLGIAQERMGRLNEARTNLLDAIQRDPTLENAYGTLARIQLAQADTAGAIRSLREFSERSRDAGLVNAARAKLRELQIETQLLGEPVDTVRSPAPAPSSTPVIPLTDTPG